MKDLWIFTMYYPLGGMENSVGHELPAFSDRFERLILFPMFTSSGVRRIPRNAEVKMVLDDPFQGASLLDIIRNYRTWKTVLGTVRDSEPIPGLYRKHKRRIWSMLRQALRRALVLRNSVGSDYDPSRVVLHSNWASDWATVLGIWKLMDPRVRFTTRMRGFDMFDHRAEDDWQLFQRFHMDQADHIYATTKAGHDHIVSRYPGHEEKFRVAPTATDDHGPAPWSPSETLRIVSCSNMVPLKRIDIIAEALQGIDRAVRWVHFGDGPERGRIEGMVASMPAHVQVDLRGSVSNEAILAFYSTEPVDLFVHMSSTEGGVAVAIQEAVSFGIPVIAAEAGGVPEIVTPHTGELLPWAVTPELLRERLGSFSSVARNLEYRSKVREFWLDHFDAARVHKRFAAILAGADHAQVEPVDS